MAKIALMLSILSCFFFIGCVVQGVGNNKFEGFFNKQIQFQDYSKLGGQYAPLHDILLKIDTINYMHSTMDTILDEQVQLAKYSASVGMKIGEWGVSGVGTPELHEAELQLELFASTTDVGRLFELFENEIQKLVLENEDFNTWKTRTRFNVYQVNGKYILTREYIPQNKNGFIEFYLPDKYFKITLKEDSPEASNYSSWVPNYVLYNMTRGLAFQIDDDIIELNYGSRLNNETLKSRIEAYGSLLTNH